MAKEFASAQIEVYLEDGSEKGLRRSLGTVKEDLKDSDIQALGEIVNQLAVYPTDHVLVTSKHRYTV